MKLLIRLAINGVAIYAAVAIMQGRGLAMEIQPGSISSGLR